jgi:hypothetical protein
MINMSDECEYEGPELETLPGDVSEVVKKAMVMLPANVRLVLDTQNWPGGTDQTYRVDFGDFDRIYISNSRDTDVEAVHMFRSGNQYTIRIEGNAEGKRKEALGYEQDKLWTVAMPGDQILINGMFMRRFRQWVEARPKEGKHYNTGRQDRKPMSL